ncbi:MAG: DUF167 domain-containing protein [Candidatus Omnitrophica bacterium]|nr:DUF167 domain-containing protein [Candidatus Omnitrophota bacterium]
MKISVKVKAGSSREKVEKTGEGDYSVWVMAKPAGGKANEAVTKALAGHFDIAKSRISLIKGHTSKQKIFEIDN